MAVSRSLDYLGRVAALTDSVAQSRAEPLEDRSVNQEVNTRLVEPIEYFGQVLRHRPLVTIEPQGLPLCVPSTAKRPGGQGQPGGPTFGPLDQDGGALGAQA